jgi:hypothetical protein
MTELSKITRIKFGLIIVYLLSLFTPIYSLVIFGTKVKVSISELGGGTFFVVFFFILAIATVITHFAYKEYHKYVYLGTTGFILLFLFLLMIFKDSSASFRLTFYIQFIIVVLLLLAYSSEELVIRLFDTTVKLIKKWWNALVIFIKKKSSEIKQKRADKATETEDEENEKSS